MQYFDDTSEVGGLYIVPTPTGGKKVIRRPHPPPTTLPLDDDFDAYTIDTEWAPRRTSSGLKLAQRSHHLRRESQRAAEDENYPEAPHGESTFGDDEDEYGKYTQDVEVVVGHNVDTSARPANGNTTPRGLANRRMGSIIEEQRPKQLDAVLRPRAGSNSSAIRPNFRPKNPNPNPTTRITTSTNSLPNLRSNQNARDGQLVQRRVLEDGPERTVTVWRKEVARNVQEDEGHASVYYLPYNGGMDDTMTDVGNGNTNANPDTRARASGEFDEFGRVGPGPGSERESSKAKRIESPLRRNHSYTPSEDNEVSTPTDSALRSPISPRAQHQHTQVYPHPHVPITPPRTSTPNARRVSPTTTPPSRSHTPNTNTNTTNTSPGPVPSSGHSPSRNAGQPKSPRAPAHAYAYTPSLQLLLATTQPPLTHLAPVLARLGIRSEEHLRAVAKMSAEGAAGEGYREVREAALGKGVSVVEWAILVDRLRAL